MNAAINLVSDALARDDDLRRRISAGRSSGVLDNCLTYAAFPRSLGPESSLSTIAGESRSRSSSTLVTTPHGMPAALAIAAIACEVVSTAVAFTAFPSHFFAPDVVAIFEIVTIVPC